MTAPDHRSVAEFAEHLGVSESVVVGACAALGLDVSEGVHHSYFESVRQVVSEWLREGRLS